MDSIGKAFSGEYRKDIDVKYLLNSEGVQWQVGISPLTGGFSTSIRVSGEKDFLERCMLDYKFSNPSTARLHLSSGSNRANADSLERKLSRLAIWAKAIRTFDTMMTREINDSIPIETLKGLFQDHKIPRIRTVDVSTEVLNLQAIVKRIGSDDGILSWNDVVAIARREKGELNIV